MLVRPIVCILEVRDGLLTGFQTPLSREQRPGPAAFGAAALLCLVLLALLSVVQVTHLHANSSDAEHCTLCIVMHSAAPVAVAAAVVVLVQIERAAPVFEASPVVRHWRPKLFTRPPPSGC